MSGFPFSDADWFRVSESARGIVNATLADDPVSHALRFEELRGVISELKDKYGEHPLLLETEADFTQDAAQRVALYYQATQHAQQIGWIAYSIRISLARVLLEEFEDAGGALHELIACHDEVATHADTNERNEWRELQAECTRRSSPRD